MESQDSSVEEGMRALRELREGGAPPSRPQISLRKLGRRENSTCWDGLKRG